MRKEVLALIVVACGNCSMSDLDAADKRIISLAVGMPVVDFNAQLGSKPGLHELDETSSSVAVIEQPHTLMLTFGERTLSFNAGGQAAPTFVRSGLYRPVQASDPKRIASLDFTIHEKLLTIGEAARLARRTCEEITTAAGMLNKLGKTFLITESLASSKPEARHGKHTIEAIFMNPDVRPIRGIFCDIEFTGQAFQLEITNVRRAQERSNGGGDETEAQSEKSYRIYAHLSQVI